MNTALLPRRRFLGQALATTFAGSLLGTLQSHANEAPAPAPTLAMSNGFADPARSDSLETLMRELRWVSEIALGCGSIGNYDIHAIDAVLSVTGRPPLVATGASRTIRAEPHGNSDDITSLTYEYADGLIHSHFGQALKNNNDEILRANFNGSEANAQIVYDGRSFIRGGPKHHGGKVTNLYRAGAVRNIAAFYQLVTESRCENETVPRAVDGVLTCVLGREAAARRIRLTMDELLKENKTLTVDLRGLRA